MITLLVLAQLVREQLQHVRLQHVLLQLLLVSEVVYGLHTLPFDQAFTKDVTLRLLGIE